MIQINEYDKDDFDELVIEEVGNVFLVKFHSKRGGEASIRYDKNTQKKNVLDLIYLFLKMDNICKINNKLPVAKSVNKKNYVEIENLNNKKLKLCIYDPKFRSLFDLILGKYTNDRTQFLEKNDVKEMRFSVSSSHDVI